MNRNDFTVYIVDDDQSVRDALGLMLSVRSYKTALFADAASFLDGYRPDWRGCLLLDLRMPGMDGLTLQQRLNEIGCDMPVIVVTGHGDVESARRAFRSRAVDFLEKPLDHKRLIASIEEAFARQSARSEIDVRDRDLSRLLATLTPREREIMERVVAGRHNRDIAAELEISARTVEVHKARVMQKLQVTSIADLVRLSLRAQRDGELGSETNA
ncbi:MAG: sigma-70 family RNA polymerase sigma factor [Betaproteobacteria bacterium]|nr:sigma-70 family RNA polymerase sigma factor [Betaproteobacteria bacterium]